MSESALMWILIGVLFYVAFIRKPVSATELNSDNTTQNPTGGTQQQSSQNEFDKVLALIKSGVDAIGNIFSNAQTSVQRN